ncbi:unnamed protein product, partial [Mesorhabditis spiculigera]
MASRKKEDLVELRAKLLMGIKRSATREPSLKLATEVLTFLMRLVRHEKYDKVETLLEVLHENGSLITAAYPSEFVIRNLVLAVSKIARDEGFRSDISDATSAFNSLTRLWIDRRKDDTLRVPLKDFREKLIDGVRELQTEMETCRENIVRIGTELISTGDIVMVHSLNSSTTIQSFLKDIREKHKLRIMSVQNSSEPLNNDFPVEDYIKLCEAATKMAHVTKVVLSAITVFPDGSCLLPPGGRSICLSAQRHNVPVYVLCAFYKIAPYFLPDPSIIIKHTLPGLPFGMARKFAGRVRVLQPAIEYTEPGLVSLYVTNTTVINPHHVYRIITDYYHQGDVYDSPDFQKDEAALNSEKLGLGAPAHIPPVNDPLKA